MRSGWLIALLAVAFSGAQDPVISPQARVSLDPLNKSASETTGAATLDGREILAGFVDFRTDGTITNSFGVTSDGGQTWAHLVLRAPVGFQDALEADPMTAYDARTNTLFAGGISRAKCIYVAQKIPGQNAFGPSKVAAASSWPDKGWMAAGPRPNLPDTTRLYITYNEGVIWSDDFGSTWTPPQSLGTGFGFLPRVGTEGQLYLTYWDGYWGIKFSKSMDGGQTWTAPVQPATRMTSWGVETYGIPGTFRNFTNNAMAVSPVTGEIVILYVDQTNIVNGQKNLDLYLVRSSDGGESWADPERMPFRPLNQVSDMIFPWIEFTADGRLHLFAMDTALNPGQTDGVEPGLWDQTYYYSDDDGVTWSSRFRLTPSSWDSSFHNTGSTKFLGDYQGIAATYKNVLPVYPDTRTGQAEVYINSILNPIERPLSITWNNGAQVGGSLESLFRRDGDAIEASPGWQPGVGPTAQFETVVPVPTSAPASVRLLLWSSVNQMNLVQTLEIRNPLTGQWIHLNTRPAPTTFAATQITISNAPAFMSQGTIRLRATFRNRLRLPTREWQVRLDQFVLLVEP